MSIPSSVNHISLPRTRAKRQGPRRRLRAGEEKPTEDSGPSSEIGVGGTLLDFGKDGGAGLEKRKGRWDWVWAGTEQDDIGIHVVADGTHMLYPATRSVGPILPELPLKSMLSSAVEYTKSIEDIGDPDHIREAITEEITTTYSRDRAGTSYDPFRGHTIGVVTRPGSDHAQVFLLFPTGEVSHHLNIGIFSPPGRSLRSRARRTTSTPYTKALARYKSEILQVLSVDIVSPHRLDYEATSFIVRLNSTTYFYHLIPNPDYIQPATSPPVSLLPIAELMIAQTGDRRHVDIALDSHTWGRALVVDAGGGVWMWREEKVERIERMDSVMRLKQVRNPDIDSSTGFYRIAFGTRPGTALLLSEKTAIVLDLESEEPNELVLLTLAGRGRRFTSLDKTASQRGSSHTALCTNHEVIWVDELQVGAQLSWSHHIGNGDTLDLELNVVGMDGMESTIISSKSADMSMVYHVASTPHIRSLHSPYILDLPKYLSSVIHLRMTNRKDTPKHQYWLIGVEEDGSVHASPLAASMEAHTPQGTRALMSSGSHSKLRIDWDEDVQKLAAAKAGGELLERTLGKSGTKYKEVDCRWVWLEINDDTPRPGSSNFRVKDLERHLRELDGPFETLVTAGDIARDHLSEGAEGRRSQGLLSLRLPEGSNQDTFAALDKHDLSRHMYPIHAIDPVHKSSTTSIAFQLNSASAIHDALLQEYPAPVVSQLQNRSVVQHRHKAGIARLTLNLALSSSILSSDPITATTSTSDSQDTLIDDPPISPEELFARAAEKLSLRDREPPKIELSYLRPLLSDDRFSSPVDGGVAVEEADNGSILDRLQSIPVRSLLSEWTVDTSPSEYVWQPFHPPTSSSPIYSQRQIRPLPPSPRQSQFLPSSIVPPSRTIRPMPSVQMVRPVITNPRSSPPPVMPQSSFVDGMGGGMGDWANTQVERGKHGGRLSGLGAKKKLKKRVGGF